MSVVAKVQVRPHVRRPVGPTITTFLASSIEEGAAAIRVVGHWNGKARIETYTWPWSSVVAVRWLNAEARR